MSNPPYDPNQPYPPPVDPFSSPPSYPSYEVTPPPYQTGQQYPGAQSYPGPQYPTSPSPFGEQTYQQPYQGQQPYQSGQPTYSGSQQPYMGGQQGYPGQQPYPGGQQPYPGYQPQPQRKSNVGMLVALGVVVALVLVGGGLGAAWWLSSKHKNTNNPVAQGSNGPSASSAPSSTGGGTHPGDLRTFLINAPTGSHDWSQPLGTNKALNLDQAADLSSDAASRKAALQKYGYKAGAVQCWIGTDDSVADVRLYQFGTVDDADSFFSDDIDGTSQGAPAGSVTDVAAVPEAKSFADTAKDDKGYVGVISIGHKGDVVLVVSIRQVGKINLAQAEGYLKQQYDKL